VSSPSYAIALAIGPDQKEVERTRDLIDSINAYAPELAVFVMIDDAPEDRHLESALQFPSQLRPVSLHHPRHGAPPQKFTKSKGICAAIQTAFAWIAKNSPDVKFVLKLDTDALIIAPFNKQILSVIEQSPEVGMMGAYDKTPNGDARDISYNAKTVKALHEPGSFLQSLKYKFSNEDRAVISRHITTAREKGYQYGEHCLGGAYAVSGELLRRMNAAGYLDNPARWLSIDCPEDVMVGIYTRVVGMNFRSFVDRNEAFGIRYKGLADTPEKLVERGYSVIHSVKNDANFTEEQIREFFKEKRSQKPGARSQNTSS
jgi:hypothetical protein